MRKSLSYDDTVRLEDLFDKFTEQKNACLSDAQRQESLLDFVCLYRDTDDFETLEQYEDAVLNKGVWDFECDTKAPEDPQPKADAEDAERRKNGQEPCFNGYYYKTTFWQDFSIADAYGTSAVEDTFKRAFPDWRNNCIYLTELVLVLNWKIWQWHDRAKKKTEEANNFRQQAFEAKKAAKAAKDPAQNAAELKRAELLASCLKTSEAQAAQADELAHLYNKLWKEADEFACDNLKGAESAYFYNVTD